MLLNAQPCSSITGIVKDALNNEPLPGASIRIKNKPAIGIMSSEVGTFAIEASRLDTLFISFIGYEDNNVIVESCDLSVLLVPMTTSIDEVVVKADRLIAEEFTYRKLSRLEIYTNPSAKADPILAVNSMPFATTTDESANISLRGGSPAETGVFLNDVPIQDAVRYSQLNGLGTFSIFNTALIDRVNVYPGNPPLEFGNSTSGVIALESIESTDDKPSTSLSVTLAGLGLYHSRKLNKKSALTMFSNMQSSVLFNEFNHRSLPDLKGFSLTDVGLHYFAELSPNTTLKIFNYSLYESYKYRYVHPTKEGIFKQDKARNFTVANIRKQIRKASLTLNQGLSFSSADYTFSIMDINSKLKDYFVSFNVHHMGKNIQWKSGLVYYHQNSTSRGRYPTYPFAMAENFPSRAFATSTNLNVPEAYAYVKHYLGSRVILGGGVRKNIPTHHQQDYLTWQGNLNYRPTEYWNINLSAGDYNKYVLPQTGESYLLKSRQYSIDASFQKQRLELSSSLFHKKIQRPQMIEEIYGVELYGRYRFNEHFRSQLSFTSLDAKQENGLSTPYDIHYFIRGNIEYKVKGTWTFTLVFLFRQGSFYNEIDHTVYREQSDVYEPFFAKVPTRLPGYNMIDFSASKIFMLTKKSTAIAFLSIGNLPGFTNVRSYSYNFDYSERSESLFSKRILYFGLVINF